jgi:Holliday junction resolvase
VKNLILSKEDIETLIKYREQFGENEATVEAKGKETKTYFINSRKRYAKTQSSLTINLLI